MDFSSIVLMERDKESGMLTKEVGSYKVEEGAEYITRAFCEEGIVHITFDTGRDVEDWEYSAIYDNFSEENFKKHGFEITFDEDEYNPTWLVKFKFIDDYSEMESKISLLCTLIRSELESTFKAIEGKEEEYKEEI
ncbi:MAG: hypothetical protein GX895_10835 [Clostridiales bacterium]|uniref:DUF6762 family protein n=1 Tax=Clostridium sp. N3C TaxID=1776758 RepID=UPI00092E1C73|nr:DUF6762 family protein [Clostridium sp. N3C]NLZ49250.1 hypothetical protein [Clostridiales bacterium]SCN24799.1 hypothetical protein N3C_1985 [Clostridium sp. N3C]